MKKYLVKEIFGPTIEGEGSQAGAPVLFLRLSGCNRWSGKDEDKSTSICHFCDTDFVGGNRMTSLEIINKLLEIHPDHLYNKEREKIAPYLTKKKLVISGGEPTLQMDYQLLRALKESNFEIHVETNGSRRIDIKTLTLIDHLVMSPKQSILETKLGEVDDLKLLYPYLKGASPKEFRAIRAKNKFIQPVHDFNYRKNLKGAIQQVIENPDYKLSIQLHKVIKMP